MDTFVDKSVLKYRFCGILLSTWDNFGGQVLFANLLLVPICAVFGVTFNCGQDQILLSGAVGISTSAILILVDKSINLSGKKRMIRLNLLDYLENFCKVRLEQEALHPEQLEQFRREYFQPSEVKKQISATVVPMKEKQNDELNRRRDARRKKEEEKKAQAKKREEEQLRIEEARREEEQRRIEERKLAAARRREEQLQKLEEEKEALEARRMEARRKAEEKQLAVEQRRKQSQEKEKMQRIIEEDQKSQEEKVNIEPFIKEAEETAADHEIEDKLVTEKEKPQKQAVVKPINRNVNPQEEKIIEDVLKEFFA